MQTFDYIFNVGGDFSAKINGMTEATGAFSAQVEGAQGFLSGLGQKLAVLDLASGYVQKLSDSLNGLSASGIKLDSQLHDLSAVAGVTGDGLRQIEGYARQSAKAFGTDASVAVEGYKLLLSQLSPELGKYPSALKSMGESIQTTSKLMGNDGTAAAEVLTTAMNFGASRVASQARLSSPEAQPKVSAEADNQYGVSFGSETRKTEERSNESERIIERITERITERLTDRLSELQTERLIEQKTERDAERITERERTVRERERINVIRETARVSNQIQEITNELRPLVRINSQLFFPLQTNITELHSHSSYLKMSGSAGATPLIGSVGGIAQPVHIPPPLFASRQTFIQEKPPIAYRDKSVEREPLPYTLRPLLRTENSYSIFNEHLNFHPLERETIRERISTVGFTWPTSERKNRESLYFGHEPRRRYRRDMGGKTTDKRGSSLKDETEAVHEEYAPMVSADNLERYILELLE